MNTALPMKILPFGAVAVSPVTGSRHSSTRVTPVSSSAQPVTGSAPCTPVVPSLGVSNEPNGGAGASVTRGVAVGRAVAVGVNVAVGTVAVGRDVDVAVALAVGVD